MQMENLEVFESGKLFIPMPLSMSVPISNSTLISNQQQQEHFEIYKKLLNFSDGLNILEKWMNDFQFKNFALQKTALNVNDNNHNNDNNTLDNDIQMPTVVVVTPDFDELQEKTRSKMNSSENDTLENNTLENDIQKSPLSNVVVTMDVDELQEKTRSKMNSLPIENATMTLSSLEVCVEPPPAKKRRNAPKTSAKIKHTNAIIKSQAVESNYGMRNRTSNKY